VELRHPLSGGTYRSQEDGLVRVEEGGRVGLFHPDGRWHSGDLRDADLHLLLWVGGPGATPSSGTGGGRARANGSNGAPQPVRSYQDLLDADGQRVPDALRLRAEPELPVVRVPIERYTSRAFHDLEVARLWRKVWQMACREEALARAGDHVVYEIAEDSVLVVRTPGGDVRAFHNVCLHRGRLLREGDGNASELRCPFHGWTWNLDGTLKSVPCRSEFPEVREDEYRLPEVRVGLWGGFVFVNLDPGAEPLERFLGDLPAHFAAWPLETRATVAHVAKRLPCNWKVAQEAFMEAYHVGATHPQLLPGIGDLNSQYDVFGNFSRAITANMTPSPHLGFAPSEQEMLDSFVSRSLDEEPALRVPDGTTARRTMASGARRALAAELPGAAELSDAELADSFYYTLFPNFHPWGAYNRIVYRFRPWRSDPDRCVMEVIYLAPFRGERPPPARVHWLGDDEDWTRAPELGFLTRVFNQDTRNLAQVQRGLHAARHSHVTFALRQELKIRHFHALLARQLGVEP
jgi:phenylpropionate dioxygenase-like ring-hydroxylating dioxygenase large terminal subunit